MNDPESAPSEAFPKSHTTINGHPIHPMLIPLPITTLVGALVTDLVFIATQDVFWARVSFWLLVAGIVTGAAAALTGSLDFWSNERIRAIRGAWVHMLGNGVVMILALINVLLRSNNHVDAVVPVGILLSAFTALLLVITGWFGGELVFRERVGVQPTYESAVAEIEATRH